MEGRKNALIIEQNIATCPIAILSLRNNSLENDLAKILPVLAKMPHLKSLDLGGSNFNGLKHNKKYSNNLNKILTELADLISNNESVCKFFFFF